MKKLFKDIATTIESWNFLDWFTIIFGGLFFGLLVYLAYAVYWVWTL